MRIIYIILMHQRLFFYITKTGMKAEDNTV